MLRIELKSKNGAVIGFANEQCKIELVKIETLPFPINYERLQTENPVKLKQNYLPLIVSIETSLPILGEFINPQAQESIFLVDICQARDGDEAEIFLGVQEIADLNYILTKMRQHRFLSDEQLQTLLANGAKMLEWKFNQKEYLNFFQRQITRPVDAQFEILPTKICNLI